MMRKERGSRPPRGITAPASVTPFPVVSRIFFVISCCLFTKFAITAGLYSP